MAKFWDNLKYHEDTEEKHRITSVEIDFLKKLQKEMNTHDHQGQEDPRYWVIKDFYEVYGKELNNADGFSIFDSDTGELIVKSYYRLFASDDFGDIAKRIVDAYEDDFSIDDFVYVNSISELEELFEEKGYEDKLVIREYEIIVRYSGFFLTQKAAEKHLRENEHHYSDDATTYGVTAWRSEEVEMLYHILKHVDFDQLS